MLFHASLTSSPYENFSIRQWELILVWNVPSYPTCTKQANASLDGSCSAVATAFVDVGTVINNGIFEVLGVHGAAGMVIVILDGLSYIRNKRATMKGRAARNELLKTIKEPQTGWVVLPRNYLWNIGYNFQMLLSQWPCYKICFEELMEINNRKARLTESRKKM